MILNFLERAEVFFRYLKIFLVVIFNPEPLQNFWWQIRAWAVGHKIVHLFGERGPIFQIELAQNDPKRREIVVLLLVQLPGHIQRGQRRLVILCLKRGLADVVLRLRCNRALGELFQELPESVDHALRILLLAKNEGL